MDTPSKRPGEGEPLGNPDWALSRDRWGATYQSLPPPPPRAVPICEYDPRGYGPGAAMFASACTCEVAE